MLFQGPVGRVWPCSQSFQDIRGQLLSLVVSIFFLGPLSSLIYWLHYFHFTYRRSFTFESQFLSLHNSILSHKHQNLYVLFTIQSLKEWMNKLTDHGCLFRATHSYEHQRQCLCGLIPGILRRIPDPSHDPQPGPSKIIIPLPGYKKIFFHSETYTLKPKSHLFAAKLLVLSWELILKSERH